MAEKIRVLIQMRHSPGLERAFTAAALAASDVSGVLIAGFALDEGFAAVKLPGKIPREVIEPSEVGRMFSFDSQPENSTYLVRGEVENDEALNRLINAVEEDPNGVEIFSDPRISAIAVCPSNPVGDHDDVASLLQTPTLHARGMDGSNVMVAIVDTGVNLAHLHSKGKNPQFDANKSWSPVLGPVPGDMPVDHGSMCAFDVCIAAPSCTLLDYALLLSQEQGETAMDGFLSDAIKAFSKLLELLSGEGENKPALVVNNSWGMFHPSWDFPVGHPGNYSDNPNHPFSVIVESLEDAGADILFAAGNCGSECPDGRCQGVTNRPIYGANSSSSVICVAAVTKNKVRLGYSSQGPGHLDENKPDLCAYSHFAGSDVYPADGGTSAACPVAAGVVAAIRSVYSPADLSPAQLRNLLRRTSEDIGLAGFDYSHGFGVISVPGILAALDLQEIRQFRIGESVSGTLKETGATSMFKLTVGDSLNIELNGPQGVDFDIYVKKDAEPTETDYDHRGYTGSADEKIQIKPTEPGEYYIMIRSYRGTGDFILQAVLQ